MGSSSSCLPSLTKVIYICFDKMDYENKEKYQFLKNQLEKENITILTSNNLFHSESKYNDLNFYIKDFINKVPLIIVCINKNYLKCRQQIKELNTILDRENNILYVNIDNNLIDFEFKGLIKKNNYFIYDENCIEKILTVFNKI